MITKGNLKKLLSILEYTEVSPHRFKKEFTDVNCSIEVDFISEKIIYPQDRGSHQSPYNRIFPIQQTDNTIDSGQLDRVRCNTT